MASKIKWVATKGAYAIDRVEETPVQVPYRGTDGNVYGAVDGVRIVGYVGDVAVVAVTIAGSHSMTRANYREALARKVQEAGGSWLGRSQESEAAKADEWQAAMYDPRVTPDAADRKALRDAYYGRTPHPSTY